MYTFQDLQAIGEDEAARAEFCRSVVNGHIGSREYRYADLADEYYHKHEPDIEQAMKFFYTVTGKKVEDPFASNYKLKFLFFRKKVTQHTAYVLNKGIIMDDKIKKQLDPHLEKKAKMWTKYAMVAGKSYVFFNNGHIDVFHMICNAYHPGFAPLYDAYSGDLAAGVRFWFRSGNGKNLITMTLYEPDGYTRYNEMENGGYTAEKKQAYKSVRTGTAFESETIGENYGRLPIVEAVTNDCRESELVGLREDIVCYEFIKSGLANQIEDLAGFFWAIKNAGGMTDFDLAEFLQRMKTLHAAVVGDDGSGGASAEPHTQSIDYAAHEKMLEILRADLHENAHLVDMKSLSAAQKTTQEIQSVYNDQDNYCGDLRDYIIDVIDKLMVIAGIPETDVAMEFDKVVNVTEVTNAVMTALPVIGDEISAELLPMLNADQKARVLQRIIADGTNRITDKDNTDEPDENGDDA